MSESLVISCDDCVMQHTASCADCVVTFLCDRPAGDVVLDAEAAQALRVLAAAGLVPGVRHLGRTPAGPRSRIRGPGVPS